MGNYFDKEREYGHAAREFNKKTAIVEAEYKKAIEKLENETMFESEDICKTAAWFNFKHSPVVSALVEFNYNEKLMDRTTKHDEKMSITEELVFGEDTGKVSRMKSIYEKIDAVELTKNAYMSNDVAALVEGAFNLIPLFCLYEEDAEEIADKEEEKSEEDKKDSEKEESKEEDESKKDDESKDEEKDVADDKDDDEDDEKSEEESEDENNTDLIEQYLTEAKRRKARPPHVVKAAYKLRKKAVRLAGEGDVEDAVTANEKAARLEAEADEINRGK